MAYTKEEIAKELKNAVEWLIDQDEGCVTIKLDDKLGICVGWLAGYGEEHRDDCIQSKAEPDFAINAGIKVYTSDDMRTDYEFINMPYYENGDVVMTDVSIEPNEDYDELAEYLLKEYEGMKDLEIDEQGLIIEKSEEVEDEHEVEVPWGGTEHREMPSDYTKEESLKEGDEGPEHGYASVEDYERAQKILDEMSALRKAEAEEGDKLLRAWAVQKTMPDEEFHEKSEKLHKETQEKVEALFKELTGLTDKANKNESLKEDLDDMKSLANDLSSHFNELGAYYEIWPEEDGLSIEINWGDWKHDHLWCDYEVNEFVKSKNHEVVSHAEELTDEDGSDTYSAIHSYIIK